MAMSTRPGGAERWPEHLPVGAVRVGRSSAHYDQTIRFDRDLVGLPVLDSFAGSYGEDGTIFGLPDPSVQLEVVRSTQPAVRTDRIDMLVCYLPDAAAQERLVARMAAAGVEPTLQHPYWQANGGVTFQDPDGREVVFVSWVYGLCRTKQSRAPPGRPILIPRGGPRPWGSYQGSAPRPVSPGTHPPPAQTMYRWRPLWPNVREPDSPDLASMVTSGQHLGP
jgi:hypothetical protein